MQSSWLIFLLSHVVVENRTNSGNSCHFCYPSKQSEFLSEKLEINPRRKFLFQMWDFGFPLHVMVQHCTNFRGMQLLFSILVYIHLLSLPSYTSWILSCISFAGIQKYW